MSVRVTIDAAGPVAPAQVRDADLRLVTRAPLGQAVELDPGDYVATVTLPGGGEEVQSFTVADAEVHVMVGAAPPASAPGARARPRRKRSVLRWHLRVISGADGRPLDDPPSFEATPREGGGVDLTFTAADLPAPAFLQTGVEGQVPRSVALPLAPYATCGARVEIAARSVTAYVIPAGNTPHVEALARYLATGQLIEAGELVADVAQQMLYGKQLDPIGAAIGGYALLRLGRLDAMHDWPANLASWFDWLPDGAVIAAELAARGGDDTAAAEHLREAVRRGIPVFSDGLSLVAMRAEQLLPGDARAARMSALARFAELGRLTVSLPGIDPTDAARNQRPRARFGRAGGWTAFRGTDPEEAR